MRIFSAGFLPFAWTTHAGNVGSDCLPWGTATPTATQLACVWDLPASAMRRRECHWTAMSGQCRLCAGCVCAVRAMNRWQMISRRGGARRLARAPLDAQRRFPRRFGAASSTLGWHRLPAKDLQITGDAAGASARFTIAGQVARVSERQASKMPLGGPRVGGIRSKLFSAFNPKYKLWLVEAPLLPRASCVNTYLLTYHLRAN